MFTNKKSFILFALISLSCALHILFVGYPKLLIEEAYYWNYAQHLDIGYIDHPPMIALLIKLSTWIWGHNEFAVRFPAWCCWGIAAFYCYRLSELIHQGSGWFACLLLCVLPFGFVYSFFITPDTLLMALWSALLFYLYRALCLGEQNAWYLAGIILGLGLLSKYSIMLLAFSSFIYMAFISQARTWFLRKEPYLAAIISLIIFSPVIYWNATHEWISFAFQTTRRINEHSHSNLPNFLGFVIVFFTPIGLEGLFRLWRPKADDASLTSHEAQQFMRIFAGVPLLIFCLFSLNHTLKFDWIGPTGLAVAPWFASMMQTQIRSWRLWAITCFILLCIYGVLLITLSIGIPNIENLSLLKKYGDWEQFSQKVTFIAEQHDSTSHNLIIIPLDSYAVASELSFYQKKQPKEYPIIGAQLFGYNSLMFDMWTKNYNLHNKKIMFIAAHPYMLESAFSSLKLNALTQQEPIWPYKNKQQQIQSAYYYQIAELQ